MIRLGTWQLIVDKEDTNCGNINFFSKVWVYWKLPQKNLFELSFPRDNTRLVQQLRDFFTNCLIFKRDVFISTLKSSQLSRKILTLG